ncbi:aldo/keto reductase [uncultured Propionibacterium sp.]|uniref:aldo/keto reductase n=1 Tax=uncultured Propionibacterium sp. TaxID=218066 RepID=UPI002930BB68|nr:aldo/keto reductase [uncultured Propionibacterium sp.]
MDERSGDPAPQPHPEGIPIGELAETTGLSVDTLRYYERAGLMRDPVPRDGTGRRVYGPADTRWVAFLVKLRRSGMPIGMIRRYARLARRGEATAHDRLMLLREHRHDVLARLDGLGQDLAAIDHKIELYQKMGDAFMLHRTRLGGSGLETGVIGLGCMGMSAFYTGAGQDEDESVRTIRRALDLGCTLIDTAEIYGPCTNEELVGRALRGVRDQAVVATKFGMLSNPADADGVRRYDGSPENIRLAVEGSLRRLGTDRIDLYYQHRPDPTVPIEETAGALAELVAEGKILAYGLSEADGATIRRAHAVHPVAAVQTEYSLWSRDVEDGALPVLRELGIALVPYSPLGRGFLTGSIRGLDQLDPDDFRRANPRFADGALESNLRIVEAVEAMAEETGATPAQVALAWLLAKGGDRRDIVPIPGTRHLPRMEENLAAAAVRLTDRQVAELDDLPRPRGERYPDMKHLTGTGPVEDR